MVSLEIIPLIAILEVIVILLFLSGFLFWRMRQMRNSEDHLQHQQSEKPSLTPFLYLKGEAAKTRSFSESLQAQPDAEPRDPELRSALGVRAGLLSKESELAKLPSTERNQEGWRTLAQNVNAIIAQEGYARQIKTAVSNKVYGEDSPPSENIVAQQARSIKHLQDYIQQLLAKMGHQPLPDIDVQTRFDELERINTELSQCLAVLEDENGFLRDQIAALLKLDQSPGAN